MRWGWRRYFSWTAEEEKLGSEEDIESLLRGSSWPLRALEKMDGEAIWPSARWRT
jgi:hypothetical protein